ncbi:NCS2 family permease [Streptomyces gilvosporeus]|uniref:MFS transporter n=1 Tax=Streptomyces gilvosporeus TaxID=553510 RepID=A0A1V0TZ51_9ACTN|nr:NCS2 family permease [Streptomyces gilvosporeus]ARF58167.1 MFS transporter [Streptomyces gilvosporeus]
MTQQSTEPQTVAEDAGEGSRQPAGRSWLDRYFHISDRGSSIPRELRGGITTFMAMCYILLLNPVILGSVQDVKHHTLAQPALVTATAFGAALCTLLMGFIGKVPLALAAGLNVSAALTTQVVPNMTWPQAMGMCVMYGVVICLLVVTGLREMVMNAIPLPLKHAITMGIGMFVALIGLVKAGFVAPGKGTPVTLGLTGELSGWPVLFFCFTLLLIFVLQARKVPGAILIGIIAGTVVSIAATKFGGLTDKDWGGAPPALHGSAVSMPDFGLFGHVQFGGWDKVGALSVGMIVFTLVLAGFFDAMATIIGVGTEAKLADDKGRMPGLSKALFVDGAGGAIGGLTGASGQTVFIESASGVGEGARTGLSSVVTGLFFAACLFFTPLTQLVPAQVAAAALVVIGSMMMSAAAHVDWSDRSVSIPVFLTVGLMPFTYQITTGVGAGVIAYTAIKAAQGKWREIGPFMWVLTGIFLVYFSLHPIEQWLGVK